MKTQEISESRPSRLRLAIRTPARRIASLLEEIAAVGLIPTKHGRWVAENRARLMALKNRHRGSRCFIIGNGPSLNPRDLDLLQSEVTIAANKIYLLFDQTEWRPTYLAVIDELVAAGNREELRALGIPKILGSQAAPFLLPDENATVVKSLPNPLDSSGIETPDFSDDMAHGAYGGYSVAYLALQAAAHMGMREVYLLGVDFAFTNPVKTVPDEIVPGQVFVASGEQNHFSPEYRKPGERWTYPRLNDQRKAFLCARRYFEEHNGRLMNASRRTELDVLERIPLEMLLAQDS